MSEVLAQRDAPADAVPDAGEVSAFLARAAARLRPDAPGPLDPTANLAAPPRGDHSLEDDPAVLAAALARPPRLAAVLVPVVPRPGGVTVLFTRRAAHLRDHSGQVAFPGGKIDPADASPRAAALREAREEVGLAPEGVRVLGYLDAYLSGTGFLVTPVVGLLAEPVRLALNPDEVAETFEVPLAILMDPARHELRTAEWKGRRRRFYAIAFEGREIWGVTAGIVRNLYERLAGEDEAPEDAAPGRDVTGRGPGAAR